MRLSIIFLMVPILGFGQNIGQQTIGQDIAFHYSLKQGFTDEKVNEIRIENGTPVAILEKSAYRWNGEKWETTQKKSVVKGEIKLNIPETAGNQLCGIENNGVKYAGAEKGLFILQKDGKSWTEVFPENERYRWALTNVAALVFDSNGNLWFGAEQGVGCLRENKWQLYTGEEGLPFNHFTCAAAGPDGIVWFGTEK